MTKLEKILASVVMVGALVLVGFLVLVDKPQKALAGVNIANEYQATTTDSTWSTATATGTCKDTLVGDSSSEPYKTLGSIIVTKTSNATLFVYDATTTRAHSNHATTTLVAMPLTTVGTYTFDITAKRGICVIVDTTVGVASSTITFRP